MMMMMMLMMMLLLMMMMLLMAMIAMMTTLRNRWLQHADDCGDGNGDYCDIMSFLSVVGPDGADIGNGSSRDGRRCS